MGGRGFTRDIEATRGAFLPILGRVLIFELRFGILHRFHEPRRKSREGDRHGDQCFEDVPARNVIFQRKFPLIDAVDVRGLACTLDVVRIIQSGNSAGRRFMVNDVGGAIVTELGNGGICLHLMFSRSP